MTSARLLRSCVETLLAFVFWPAVTLIMLPFLYVPVIAPFIALGVSSSDSAFGVPPALLAWRSLPFLIPMVHSTPRDTTSARCALLAARPF